MLYASATGATELANLAYMDRMGLWGAWTAFPTFEHFEQGMAKRGVGALEMLAMEMKAAGKHVARGLGFHGCTFGLCEARRGG